MKHRIVNGLKALRARSFHWHMELPQDGSAIAVFGASTAVHTYRQAFFGEHASEVRVRRVAHLFGWERAVHQAR